MKGFRLLGMLVQAIVIGSLLFLALMHMTALQSGARVFEYQGF